MSQPMKDSGVEWLGDIPADWKIIKLKYLFSIIGGNGFPEILQGNSTGDYPFCKVSDINGESDYVDTASNWVSQSVVDDNRFNVISTGSIIMAKIGAALAKNHRKINMVRCCIDNNTQALVPLRNDDIRYLLYLSKCIDMSWFDNNSTVPSINNPKLLNLFVPDVPLDEQQRIATFLDDKCARIDSVIEKTRDSIEEYKKLKQAVITRAVTKGIRPNRTLKHSGVEWIGDIPSDWTALALKYLCTMQSGKNLVSEQIADVGNYPVYGGNGHRGFFDDYNCEGKKLLVGRQGALCGNVHRVTDKFWATEHAVITENTQRCDIDFLYYLLIGMNLNQYVSSTAAQPGLAVSTIQNIKTCLPPLDEQKEIAQYLDEKTSAIDSLVTKKNQLVTELESLKKSMIFEYVTGKKEVGK